MDNRDIPRIPFWGFDADKSVHVERFDVKVTDEIVDLTPHRKTHFIVRWIKEGSGEFYIDFKAHSIKSNTLVLLTPARIVSLAGLKGKPFSGFALGFDHTIFSTLSSEPDILRLLTSISLSNVFWPEDDSASRLDNIYELMLQEFEHFENFQKENILTNLVSALLYEITRMTPQDFSKKKSRYEEIYNQFTDQLNKNYSSSHLVSEYASELFTSEKTLNRACKAVTGFSASLIIQKRVNLEAKRLLLFTTKGVNEIAFDLGFNDDSHFVHYFKRLNNLTPLNFRENNALSKIYNKLSS